MSDEAVNAFDLWQQPFPAQLSAVLSKIRKVDDMQRFLRDVMTEKEIIEISARLQAARMLEEGETYASVNTATQLSSRTIARISDWLTNGLGGYALALSILRKK